MLSTCSTHHTYAGVGALHAKFCLAFAFACLHSLQKKQKKKPDIDSHHTIA